MLRRMNLRSNRDEWPNGYEGGMRLERKTTTASKLSISRQQSKPKGCGDPNPKDAPGVWKKLEHALKLAGATGVKNHPPRIERWQQAYGTEQGD